MDAVDTALVNIEADRIELVDFLEYPVPESIREPLRGIDGHTPLREVAMMDVTIGELFARSALDLIDRNKIDKSQIAAIGSHGQTVLHSPDSKPPCTVQIGDPNVIAARTGITTVADFRRMDIANGGQGAPFAPLFHQAYFQTDHPRIILNIGGIANVTLLSGNPEDPVSGFDTGPGNCLMDDWTQRHTSKPFDRNGEWAKTGQVCEALLAILLDDPYFSRPSPKSTGRDDFNLSWLEQKLSALERPLGPEDVQATLLRLTATTIASAVKGLHLTSGELLLCGGGSKNICLVEQLDKSLEEFKLLDTAEYGINADAIEACCFAMFACYRLKKRSINFEDLTGALNIQYPGAIYEVP